MMWLTGLRHYSNDASDLSADHVLLFAARARSDECFSMESLPQLLADRRRPRRNRCTFVVINTDDPALERAVARLQRQHRGVVFFTDLSPQRLAALLSCTSVAVFPLLEHAEAPILPHSRRFQASATGTPVVMVDDTKALPADHSALIDSVQGTPFRDASRRARLSALSAEVDISTFEPEVWTPIRSAHAVVDERPRRIVVASHDMKFAGAAIEELRARGHEVRIDEWTGHALHNEEQSRALAAWADTVWCEWTLGNAVWYSRNLPGSTSLVTRLHLQEAATAFPGEVDWSAVDAAVFVAEHLRQQVIRDTALPAALTRLIPNGVALPRGMPDPSSDSRFRLGLVGMVPARKGLREALDVLMRLRQQDSRFSLSLRGRLPDEYPWMGGRETDRQYYEQQFSRIRTEELLGDAVTFSPFGPDMDDWYANIGVVLSTSEFESFHFTIPDGAVHGAMPAMLDWPGADLLYPADWLAANTDDLAQSILEYTRSEEIWRDRVDRAREFITRTYAEHTLTPALVTALLSRRDR